MAPKKAAKPNPTPVGKPQSAYAKEGFAGGYKPGDEWFNEEQNAMDQRKTDNVPKGAPTDYSGRAMSEQLKDASKDAAKGVAGAMPSYKKGGVVHKTGPARLHKGERVIPKSKVHKVEKALRKASRKR